MSKIPGTEANKEKKMEQGTGGGMGQQGYGQGNRVYLVAVSSAFAWSHGMHHLMTTSFQVFFLHSACLV